MLRSTGSETGRRPTTILVVDDEPSVLALVRTMLWRAGYTVLEASGGEQALALAAQSTESIQLLLSDVLMPEMNGHELAEKMKTVRPEIKILFMTGYRDKVLFESTGRAMEEVPLIRKPFTAFNLVAKIEEILNQQSVEADAHSER
ncbi:MAG TPA: response regulator [Bryobacteraceae bacterium]|nr:response regulator [Bryobacteraceae bacterium]